MVDGNSLDTAESELAIAAFKQHLACCSFCGRPQTEVKTLVAGPAVFICDRCIRISSKVAEKASKNGKTEVAGLNWGKSFYSFQPIGSAALWRVTKKRSSTFGRKCSSPWKSFEAEA